MANEATKATDDGGSAFPGVTEYERLRRSDTGQTHAVFPAAVSPGMSLRDYFAATVDIDQFDTAYGVALAGPMPPLSERVAVMEWYAKANAAMRYILADAMLAARKAGVQ